MLSHWSHWSILEVLAKQRIAEYRRETAQIRLAEQAAKRSGGGNDLLGRLWAALVLASRSRTPNRRRTDSHVIQAAQPRDSGQRPFPDRSHPTEVLAMVYGGNDTVSVVHEGRRDPSGDTRLKPASNLNGLRRADTPRYRKGSARARSDSHPSTEVTA